MWRMFDHFRHMSSKDEQHRQWNKNFQVASTSWLECMLTNNTWMYDTYIAAIGGIILSVTTAPCGGMLGITIVTGTRAIVVVVGQLVLVYTRDSWRQINTVIVDAHTKVTNGTLFGYYQYDVEAHTVFDTKQMQNRKNSIRYLRNTSAAQRAKNHGRASRRIASRQHCMYILSHGQGCQIYGWRPLFKRQCPWNSNTKGPFNKAVTQWLKGLLL